LQHDTTQTVGRNRPALALLELEEVDELSAERLAYLCQRAERSAPEDRRQETTADKGDGSRGRVGLHGLEQHGHHGVIEVQPGEDEIDSALHQPLDRVAQRMHRHELEIVAQQLSIFGFTRIFGGRILVNGRDVTRLSPQEKLKSAGIAYVLQDKSIFPHMSVEENLLMRGFLLGVAQARQAAERILDTYPRLAARRRHAARVLSGGERRLLEISRALVMQPDVLLVDEPSIGLEPRYIDMVFELLARLQRQDNKTIVMVEQNAKRGLEFADIGYVLVSGELALAGSGRELLVNPEVGRLFLGG
jgi:ABC-type branched-subunit amino acid transport system ATPase component